MEGVTLAEDLTEMTCYNPHPTIPLSLNECRSEGCRRQVDHVVITVCRRHRVSYKIVIGKETS